ncbi:Chromate transporter [Caldalkalibacillus thermarum TA2.A1]|uniref:Chromate transporter n=1 Tax=Caldalkalibacillus thermarum (strain TA2.A1) TaxID=986075 RepID=F5L4P5_CALTT|nr:chromate transporter [Caldalkalibacillus thermarum]EGL83678.1 Chromate transporter [Caldalkalibacillus thermarum TA2.A1]QZT34070.1 chromate transporter [Caldalkalibacillus thermarum TA2.A1]
MIYWQLFWAFFIPGIVGYGGGPASIPLVQNEVVNRYGWLTMEEFGELLALGNTLPGPIVTKMAGYIGYELGGPLGAFVALFATVAPSLLAMIFLLGLLHQFKDSPKVKRMTALIRPTIAILLGVLGYQFLAGSWEQAGLMQTVFLAGASLLLLEKWNLHPAFVILGALVYGALFLA